MAKYINLDDMLEQFDKRASKLVGMDEYQLKRCEILSVTDQEPM